MFCFLINVPPTRRFFPPGRSLLGKILRIRQFIKGCRCQLSMNASIKIMEELENVTAGNEVESIGCECCGMSEECTPTYIERVKELFGGKWICGLCSEAVKEQMRRSNSDTMTKEEAMQSHMSLCSKFNRTIRLNPKLSLAVSMRDIARKSSEQRRSIKATPPGSMIVRAISCGPRLDVDIKQSQIQ